jgi:hypothetical protein
MRLSRSTIPTKEIEKGGETAVVCKDFADRFSIVCPMSIVPSSLPWDFRSF